MTRSTYAAELQFLTDGYEVARVVNYALASIMLPKASIRELVQLEDCGGLPLQIEAATDCMSVLTSLAVDEVRAPSEESLIMVLHELKEALLTWNLRKIWWVCATDMISDGLNKGAVARTALLQLGLTGLDSQGNRQGGSQGVF